MEITNKTNQLEKSLRSKYELTLAEFPLFIFDKKGNKDVKSIEYQDTIVGKDGKRVSRKWTVTANSKTGFGTASTQGTLFELFQIWKEDGFKNQYIQFGSIYNLLKRRGTATVRNNYARLKNDLESLVSITIKAENAFWDNERKAYVDMVFHLFDRVELYKETPKGQATLPFGRIKASDILYGSIQKNSLLIANFDSEFFYSLGPIEQRLALYLSKIFRSQATNKRELLEFASQLPINAKATKKIRQQIKLSCEGLLKKGFSLLASYEFERGGGVDFVIFKRQGPPPKAAPPARPPKKERSLLPSPNTPEELGYLTEEILNFCQDKKSLNFYKKVARMVPRNTIFRAISEARVADNMNETKKSKAAHFTYLIKRYAQEQGVDL
jgi:hypothetical protein